ncbi:MAG: hypothetical protein ACO2ZM_09865, partial [Francisellaceae bacterium]
RMNNMNTIMGSYFERVPKYKLVKSQFGQEPVFKNWSYWPGLCCTSAIAILEHNIAMGKITNFTLNSFIFHGCLV